MLSFAAKQGVAGIVINGAIRDLGTISKGSFPVYAAGVTHRGPYKDGPGEINVTIAIDGMIIEPGDLMLGDEDGLLCVPYDLTEGLYRDTKKKYDGEQKQLAEIAAGTSDRSWVDASLTRLGCVIEE